MSRGCEKRNLTQITWICVKNRIGNLNFIILDRSRGVEQVSSLSVVSYRELSKGQKVARSIDLAIERYRDCDKKKLKSSIDSLNVERC